MPNLPGNRVLLIPVVPGIDETALKSKNNPLREKRVSYSFVLGIWDVRKNLS